MATSNSRDVRMTLSVDTLGSEDIQKLQTTIANLAKEGGDAAPEFQRLADEISRIGQQADALQAFTALSEQTAALAARQEQASAAAGELRTRLEGLSATSQEAAERQRLAAAALEDARQAARNTRDELAVLTATTDRAGKSEAEYAAEVQRLKVAKIEQRAEIERLSASLAKASAEVKEAERAESQLSNTYARAAKAAADATQALEANQAAVRRAADTADYLGVTTDNIAAAQAELAQALNLTGTAAERLQQRIDTLADRERELAGIRAFQEQVEAATRMQQTAEYARLFDQAIANLTETERRRQEQVNAAQWQREAEAMVDAAHAAQELARQTAVLEAAQRELAAQNAFQQQAEAARKLQQAGEYVRFWREELDKAEEQARRTAEEARVSAERISTAFGTLGVRSAQELQTEIAGVRAAMETMRTSAGLTGAQLNTAFAAGETKIRELQRELRELNGQLTIGDRAAGLFKNSMGQIAVGNLIADGIGAIINKVKELAVEFVRTIAQTDQMRKALMAVYKDSAVAASQFDFLKRTANTAGVAIGDIQQAFVKFSAATQASGLGLQSTNELFAAVTRAAGTLGLSGEQVTGMLEALGQMASKGTVSMEELRQQLGDRLPGALSLVAKGLGLSEAQLIKLVESGGLAARDLFPALTKALGDMRGETDGLVPSYERLKNVLTETAQSSGDAGWTLLLVGGLKALTAVLGAVILPLTAFFEVIFAGAKTVGILYGALFTLTNPLEELKKVASEAADRQTRLTNAFEAAVTGAHSAREAQAAHNEKMVEAGAAAAGASDSITSTAKAQEAQAFAAKLAADSTLDLSSKIVQLKAFIDEKLSSQDKEIEAAGKLAKAAKIEGDALVELTELRGQEFATREAQLAASDQYAQALARAAEAQRTETELLVLKREEVVKTRVEQGLTVQQMRVEVDEIEKKIVASRAETEQAEQASRAAQQEVDVRRLAVQTYKDNALAVGEYKRAMDTANQALSDMIRAEQAGMATKEQVAGAQRRAAEATHLYNDAVADSVRAIELESRVRDANNNLIITKLSLEQRNYESMAAAARASGNHVLALHYEIEARRREIEMIRLKSEAMRLEAEAMIKALEIEKAALDQSDPLIKQKQAEIDIRIANAKAKLLEANAGKEAIAALEQEITLLQTSSSARDRDTSSRGANTGAIRQQTGALREQIQVMGEFSSARDLAERGSQGDSFQDADGTRYYKNAAGQIGSDGVMPGYTISAEENRMAAYLAGQGKLTEQDRPFIEANYRAAMANLAHFNGSSSSYSLDGARSVQAEFNNARRALEGLPGKGGSGAGTGGGGTFAPSGASQTVNINLGGRRTAVNVATAADAQALTGVLRQLETAAGVSA